MGAWDWSLLGPPLAAGMLVSATHVPLGREVLRRGIIFIDLAVAQIAGLVVLAVQLSGVELSAPAHQAVVAAGALTAGMVFWWTERRWGAVQEALIGSSFVLAAAGALLLTAHHPHGEGALGEILGGQLLWTLPSDLPQWALLSIAALAIWWFGGRRSRLGFYVSFALAITASVQIAGVLLVFATLILPALAVRGLDQARGLAWGYGLCAGVYGCGLWLSTIADLPAGPLVVWLLGVGALLVKAGLRARAPS